MQMARHPTLLSAVTFVVKEEGILGLFGTGKLAIQIMRDIPYAIITAVSYELLQGAINRRRDDHNNINMNVNNENGVEKVIEGIVARADDGSAAGGSGKHCCSSNNGAKKSNGVCADARVVAGGSTTSCSAPPISINNNNNFNSPNKPKSKRTSSSTYQDALCGSIAGGVSTFLTTPMDVVKTRLMSGGSQYQYTSVNNAVARIITEEGFAAFFRGTSSRLLHKIPANALFYLFYEVFRTMLGVGEQYT